MTMILKADDPLPVRSGPAEVTGTGRDGKPEVRFHTIHIPHGGLFMSPDPAALIAKGRAKEAVLSPPVKRMAEEVLRADTPLGAALAGLRAGVATWYAEQDGAGCWRPVRAPGGMFRDSFDARFRDEAEAAALWADQPVAVPIFSVRTEHGFRRAYVWQPHYLLEIATEIYSMKG